MRLSVLLVAFLGLLLPVLPCWGGWISEVWFEPASVLNDAQQIVTIPPLIEVSGLDPAFQADLVVIDARNSASRWGLIKQVITLEAGREVRVVSQGAFPPGLGNQGSASSQAGSFQVPATPFDWTGSRAILLFDRPTGLEGFTGKIGDSTTLPAPDDVVTFGSITNTRQHEDFAQRPIFDLNSTAAITRPNTPANTQPWPDLYLTGRPNTIGIIHGEYGSYVLNPGFFNRIWPAGSQPEPAAGVLLGGLMMVFLYGRQRQPADSGNGVSSAYDVTP